MNEANNNVHHYKQWIKPAQVCINSGLPGWHSAKKESTCQCRRYKRHRLDPRFGKILVGNGNHSSVLAWESQGQRNMVDYSPWGLKESDMTEATEQAHMDLYTAESHTCMLIMPCFHQTHACMPIHRHTYQHILIHHYLIWWESGYQNVSICLEDRHHCYAFLWKELRIMVHSFPTAAITDYHEPADLNQCKFIIFKFWSPKVWNGFGRVKNKMLAKLALLEALEKSLFPCLPHLLEAISSWLLPPITSSSSPCFHHHSTFCLSVLKSPSCKKICGYI